MTTAPAPAQTAKAILGRQTLMLVGQWPRASRPDRECLTPLAPVPRPTTHCRWPVRLVGSFMRQQLSGRHFRWPDTPLKRAARLPLAWCRFVKRAARILFRRQRQPVWLACRQQRPPIGTFTRIIGGKLSQNKPDQERRESCRHLSLPSCVAETETKTKTTNV